MKKKEECFTLGMFSSNTLAKPVSKSWLIGKDLVTEKYWRQKEKGMTEDDMFVCHHWFNGCEFEQILGDGEGQGSLGFWSLWSGKELDMTEQLNNKFRFNQAPLLWTFGLRDYTMWFPWILFYFRLPDLEIKNSYNWSTTGTGKKRSNKNLFSLIKRLRKQQPY